jgi:DNA-binding NarL/FixJ family response regulator
MGKLFNRRQADATQPAPAKADETRRERLRIAVVDDDDDVRELLALGLTTDAYEVVGTAADATRAIDLVEETQPDIVLLDLHMPDVGGLEVLPVLRDKCPHARVVAFSAIGATHMVENAIEAGVFGYIEKGVTVDSILKHLDRVSDAGRVKFVRPFPLRRDYA